MTHALSIGLQLLGSLLAAGALFAERRASASARGSDQSPGVNVEDQNPWEGHRLLGPRGGGTRVYPIDLQDGMRALQRDAGRLEVMRRRAASDWTDQRTADRQERASTQKRILVELFGVFLVTIGTALPDLASALCEWLR